MKNKLIVVLGVAVVVSLCLLTAAKYNAHVARQNVAAAEQQLKESKTEEARAEEIKRMAQHTSDLYAQCNVGVEAWQALPVAKQATTAKPDCDLSFN